MRLVPIYRECVFIRNWQNIQYYTVNHPEPDPYHTIIPAVRYLFAIGALINLQTCYLECATKIANPNIIRCQVNGAVCVFSIDEPAIIITCRKFDGDESLNLYSGERIQTKSSTDWTIQVVVLHQGSMGRERGTSSKPNECLLSKRLFAACIVV
jgi:hypothetical protein